MEAAEFAVYCLRGANTADVVHAGSKCQILTPEGLDLPTGHGVLLEQETQSARLPGSIRVRSSTGT